MDHGWSVVACCLPLSILCLSGCLIPYAYPNLDYIPGCELGTKMPDCHVFRVDVTAFQEDIGEKGEFTVVEIPRRVDGSFTPQYGLSIDRGVYVVGVALNYNVGYLHSTSVRLYRPGYQLIEIKPWDLDAKVQWQPTANFVEQEKVIDALLWRPAVAAASCRANTGYISTKTTDIFAAAEYDRVAALAPIPEDAARLRGKAEQLRNPKVKAETGTATTQLIPKSP